MSRSAKAPVPLNCVEYSDLHEQRKIKECHITEILSPLLCDVEETITNDYCVGDFKVKGGTSPDPDALEDWMKSALGVIRRSAID